MTYCCLLSAEGQNDGTLPESLFQCLTAANLDVNPNSLSSTLACWPAVLAITLLSGVLRPKHADWRCTGIALNLQVSTYCMLLLSAARATNNKGRGMDHFPLALIKDNSSSFYATSSMRCHHCLVYCCSSCRSWRPRFRDLCQLI